MRAIGQELSGMSYITAASSTLPTTVTYHGWYDAPMVYSATGSLVTTRKVFRIAKETRDALGNIESVKYASRGADFAWDDRETLNYL